MGNVIDLKAYVQAKKPKSARMNTALSNYVTVTVKTKKVKLRTGVFGTSDREAISIALDLLKEGLVNALCNELAQSPRGSKKPGRKRS